MATDLYENKATSAISVENIYKTFGEIQALNGVNLTAASGTVLALLGPNGAGKTTLIHILTTLLNPDSGVAKVGGYDVTKEPDKVRQIIGLTGQYAAVDENLTGRENLEMVGYLYHLPNNEVKQRVDNLLAKFELVEAAERPAKTYSGGMRRRLDLAASLIGEPQILFLDEPTTGLDPRSRREMWQTIKNLVKGGITVLLTTQYMEEAEYLADHIAIINHGRIIEQGTASQLKTKLGGEVLELHVASQEVLLQAQQTLEGLGAGPAQIDNTTNKLAIPAGNGPTILVDAILRLNKANIEIADIALRQPTLDDVFLTLTGHATEEEKS